MDLDIRAEAAVFYDLQPFPEDVPFYLSLIPSPAARILELGCGTGRVLLSLHYHCAYYHGIDKSESMLSICLEKIRSASIPREKVHAELGDITDFELYSLFDLIIAPLRVFQNLETDQQMDGLFRCVRKHLAPDGSCILNMFNPKWERNEFVQRWKKEDERLDWETMIEGGKVTCHDRRSDIDVERFITYPELIYHLYKGESLEKEVVLKIPMRVWYPDQIEKLIAEHGFEIRQRWGGYKWERYGEGPELIIHFSSS